MPPPDPDSLSRQSDAEDDELETCAVSGERHPRARMLQYGEHWVTPEQKDVFVRLLETGGRIGEESEFGNEPLDGGIGTVFRQGFRLLRTCLLPLALFQLVFWLPLDLVDLYLSWFHVDDGYLDPESLPPLLLSEPQYEALSTVIHTVGGLFGTLYFYSALDRAWEGKPPDIGADCLLALRRFFPVLAVRLMATLLILAGTLFLVLPGLFLAVRLCVVEVVGTVEKRSAFMAVQRGYYLTGYRPGLAFFFGFVALFAFGLIPGFLIPYAWEWLELESWWSHALVSWCFTLPMSCFLALNYVLYRHLRAAAQEASG